MPNWLLRQLLMQENDGQQERPLVAVTSLQRRDVTIMEINISLATKYNDDVQLYNVHKSVYV